MYMPCPICGSKTRIVTSQSMSSQTRKAYWQCLNYNCGTRFDTLTEVQNINASTGLPPDPKLQPELCKRGLGQLGLLPE